ncbi:MAG: VOC family protein [Gemmatimonadota bacterium]
MRIALMLSLTAVLAVARPAAVPSVAPVTRAAAHPSISGQVTFLYYKDVDAAARFYEEVLGLEKTFDEGWVRIYAVAGRASVGLVDETRGQHRTAADKPVMLSIVTDEIDAWYEHMVDSGAPVLSELRESANAPIRSFVVEDPGGYTVEFFQWLSTGSP